MTVITREKRQSQLGIRVQADSPSATTCLPAVKCPLCACQCCGQDTAFLIFQPASDLQFRASQSGLTSRILR